MAENNHRPPGLVALIGRTARTGAHLLRNRGELFALEWQEEKGRLVELLFWTVALLFTALSAIMLFTGLIIFLLPQDYRLWAAGIFMVLYAGAAWGAWASLRTHLKHEPFSESLEQVRKDASWLDSLQ